MEIDIHTTAGKIADLGRRIDEAVNAASPSAIEKQHATGKMTAESLDSPCTTAIIRLCPASRLP